MDPIRTPRFRWPLLLGAAGFTAGFFGPMIFVPDANQGPLVGIFISGPAGAILGFALFALCTLLRVSAQTQWRILGITVLAIALVVLVLVQPGPALRGYVMDLEVESCATPLEVEPRIIAGWTERVAKATWATPREGWQADMHQQLLEAPGVILDVRVVDQHSVWERRKPWNRGRLFATPGRNAPEESAFYDTQGSCLDYPSGRVFRAFEKYELNGRIRPPEEWPPRKFGEFISVSPISTVPARFNGLLPQRGA